MLLSWALSGRCTLCWSSPACQVPGSWREVDFVSPPGLLGETLNKEGGEAGSEYSRFSVVEVWLSGSKYSGISQSECVGISVSSVCVYVVQRLLLLLREVITVNQSRHSCLLNQGTRVHCWHSNRAKNCQLLLIGICQWLFFWPLQQGAAQQPRNALCKRPRQYGNGLASLLRWVMRCHGTDKKETTGQFSE